MSAPLRPIKKIFLGLLACFLAVSPASMGQTPSGSPTQDQTEVVRVYTDLVQTDVMVFDKAGNFVNGLRREDFDLRIDGKVRPIDFFEQVTVGTANEESLLTAARGSSSPNKAGTPRPNPLNRGRTMFFYVDDLHLDLGSLNATQKTITDFIEKEMSQNDEVAIASASGQIGFLQQLTDNRTVLRNALQRIKVRPYSVRDFDRPPMTEYQALLIDSYDRDVTGYFVQELIRMNPGMSADQAENQVRSRSHILLQQAAHITTNTLLGLESLIRSSSKLPGRKLVFFLSGGFFLDTRNSDVTGKMRRITSAAARSGAVIYSLDARGLVASLQDASTEGGFDVSGVLARASLGELRASQDSLNALARDTGGKPIFNTNALGTGLSRALKETAVYYLLAWKPDQETQKAGKFRNIEVKLKERPDLTVRVRRGFFDVEPVTDATKVKDEKRAEKTPEAQLRKAIGSPYPERAIPISLSLNYILTPDRGLMLAASMHILSEFLSFSLEDGKQKATVRIGGLVLNDRGQPGANFTEGITVTRDSANPLKGSGENVSYTHQIFLRPGLYQVRVAARDERSGHTGSAHSWIEIPDLASRRLTLSSLIIGARLPVVNNASGNGQTDSANISIDHQFPRNSDIRFLVFAYNAARAPSDSKPDLAIQVQVLRENQPVVTTSLKKIVTENIDLDRLPYAADLSLAGLPAGRYLLQVTVIDRVSKTSASQQTRFEIE
ncbi:MAG: VWA domain-containing protein [Pyrinomonadaceae bacterium]